MTVKYKDPLSKNPFFIWGHTFRGADGIDAAEETKRLGEDVKEYMQKSCGIGVSATYTDIQVGGMLSKTVQPGVIFNFDDKSAYAGVIVGVNRVAGMLDVNAVQYGAPSSAYQRLNKAEAKGALSLSGMIGKAVTNTSAVEEEAMHYSALQHAIQVVVESWAA